MTSLVLMLSETDYKGITTVISITGIALFCCIVAWRS